MGFTIFDIEPDSNTLAAILRGMAKSQHDLGYKLVLTLLRKMREEAGLTQRELAEKVLKPQPWVHKSETGERRVDINEFLLWCRACDIDPRRGFERLIAGR